MMRKMFILLLAVLAVNVSFAQSKTELIEQVNQLRIQLQFLETKVKSLEGQLNTAQSDILMLRNENYQIKEVSKANVATRNDFTSDKEESTNEASKQCKAITQKGTQCSRNADSGSEYCWQHKSTYEPNSKVTPTKASSSSGSPGRTIHTGPRGGKYYINSKGNKVYVK